MGKKFVIGLALIGFLSISGAAGAAFFDDDWYMQPSWWQLYDMDSEGRTGLVDQNDRLEWITTSATYPNGWTDGYDAFRCYGSKWAFELSNDFEFTVEFHYDHTGTYDTDEGGIEMGLVWFSHTFSIAAENWVSDWGSGSLSNKDIFYSSVQSPEMETESWWRRADSDGMLYARYDAGEDRLQFQALEGSYPDWEVVGGIDYEGLKSSLGLSQLRVYFGGWSEGAGLDSGDAYLRNFNVVNGAMIPEPASSILLIIGGAFLAAARLRRKKSGIHT